MSRGNLLSHVGAHGRLPLQRTPIRRLRFRESGTSLDSRNRKRHSGVFGAGRQFVYLGNSDFALLPHLDIFSGNISRSFHDNYRPGATDIIRSEY
jgi:hypothetical protein